jgi:monovalent cation:proton antiporter-2 (CPA2) family protein
MHNVGLSDIAVLLAAMALAAPMARLFGVPTVLGYLGAGVLLGPHVLQRVVSSNEAHDILEFAEFGIVLLLFLIGLELRPKRVWAMRQAILGLGAAQVFVTAAVLAAAGIFLFGIAWQTALFAGLALALSSTAFALQILEETGDLQQRHGRAAFAVLLFQDLAAIPLIALAPLFAVSAAGAAASMDFMAGAKAIAAIVAVTTAGYFALDPMIRLVARTKVREAMTAAALLTVVAVALVMQQVGVSASLGAFIAGALLAESSYRHQLEADIQPFEGLLLGLFFTAIGLSLNIDLLLQDPVPVLALTALLVAIKTVVLSLLGWRFGLEARPSRRLGLALSQGGEFAFVLFVAGVAANVISREAAELLILVVTLSMVLTPLLLMAEARLSASAPAAMAFEKPAENDRHVVIAGFGRYGQIVARVLRGKKIPFTALDISAEQVELVRKFGSQAFFGDASRPEILEAAQIGKARAFVLAIDDVEASMRIAEMVTAQHPKVPIFVRARNRNHVHRLYDLGIKNVQRETFLSSLETTRTLLTTLGISEREAERTVRTFRSHDERRLGEDYKHYSDMERLQVRARTDAATLQQLFEEDAAEDIRLAKPAAET